MIKKLKRKISIIFVSMLGAIWFLVIAIFNWTSYREGLSQLRSDVRLEVKQAGWNRFIRTGGEDKAFSLEGLEYCVVQMKDDGTVLMQTNHFSGRSEEELLAYGRLVKENGWRHDDDFSGITHFSKYKKHYGRCLVLISTKPVVLAQLKLAAVSLVAVVLGIVLLTGAVRFLTEWIVHSVEESMQSEKRFMSNVSHELKTPLTVIRTNIELLTDEIGNNKHLLYIGMETERMVSLVNRMLTMARLDAQYIEQKAQKFRLDEALLQVIYPMESVAWEKGIAIDIQVEEPIWFYGNEEQLQSVMTILLDNAISYTPEKGNIEIVACVRSRKFILSVANTGEPIPADARDKLFERFYRRDEAREGASQHLGLGLSIAASIVEKHHGKIRVESARGKNIFRVVLPVQKAGS